MNLENQIVLPAEWAEQEFVQLTWPHSETDWADMLDEVNECFVSIAREIIKRENLVIVCVDSDEVETNFTEDELLKITFAEMPTNDTWARDHGGITVFEDGKPVVYDFTFNGWGDEICCQSRQSDNAQSLHVGCLWRFWTQKLFWLYIGRWKY